MEVTLELDRWRLALVLMLSSAGRKRGDLGVVGGDSRILAKSAAHSLGAFFL